MWFFFALAATLAWGTADLFYKKGNSANVRSTHLRTVITVGVAMGLYAVFTLAFSGMDYNWLNIIVYMPVSLCYILSMAVGYFGLRYLELSVSSPVQNSSGALASLLCIVFLGDRPGLLSGAGIVLVCFGIIALGFAERRETLPAAVADKKYISGFKALIFPVLYCVIDSLGTFFDAYYLDSPDTTPLLGVTADNIEDAANVSYQLTFLFAAAVCLVILLIRREKLFVRTTPSRAAAAVFEAAGQGVYVYAMSGNAAVAAPMISAYCVVSLLLSRVFLREKLSAAKYLSIAVVVCGIVLMGVAEGLSE